MMKLDYSKTINEQIEVFEHYRNKYISCLLKNVELNEECVKMKPLTLKETSLKEEMKNRCLSKGQYIDNNAKDKFRMLCHLEDFEIAYWDLQQENQLLKIQISAIEEEYKRLEETNKVLSQELTKDKILKQDHLTTCCGIPIGDIPRLIEKNKELENNWNELKEHFELLKNNSTGGNKEFIEDVIGLMQELETRKWCKRC